MSERVLSCFIDESGDFGPFESHSPYYYVAVVLHDQNYDIADKIVRLESRAANEGFANHSIHTGPLIRREGIYQFEEAENRKHLFNILYHFAIHLPIRYFSIRIDKKKCTDNIIQTGLIGKALSMELSEHKEYWDQFDRFVIYYDNGQTELTKVISSAFFSRFDNVEMRRVRPADYKLFQVADLVCTMEMIHDKEVHNGMSRSELDFFDGRQCFKKNYYKKIVTKKL